MDNDITDSDIDRTYRIRKAKINGKPRPVIIKFVRYNDMKKVFSSKKLLKNLGVSITDSLIAICMKKLTNARDTFRFKNVFCSENASLHPKFCYN